MKISHLKKKKRKAQYVSLLLLCFCQRVEELEKENALLKSEKEEMNQRILEQSETSAGKS